MIVYGATAVKLIIGEDGAKLQTTDGKTLTTISRDDDSAIAVVKALSTVGITVDMQDEE